MSEASGSQCLVCTAPISSIHLGMDTCRACAAFFKRAKTTGRVYPCIKADRACGILRDIYGKITCRRCRFDKCVAIGMEYDGILRLRRNPTVRIIQRIKQESRACIERRREQELKLIIGHDGHNRMSHPTEELYDIHIDTVYEIYHIFIAEAHTFFRNVFPALSLLSVREQEFIFKDYVSKMRMIEEYHRTFELFGDQKRYIICSVMTCFDIDRPYEGMGEMENAQFLASYTKAYADDQSDICSPLFKKCALTEPEYFALMALAITEVDNSCEISEKAQIILDRYRQEVLEDLQSYYQKKLGLKDFSTRLGNLMSFNHIFQECKSLFKVFFRFHATIFDMFTTDNLMKEICL
ncbi:hypothetical protein PENTCL1PPCAC_8466 [Pristionchus entomophagus]|uniref:Nuclear receptor n=1 Tax=Pristionchus entomophagus TaxID=358040 RepID=A0AAV5SSD2_9BILA|nr:hypothetical protein PENTCL1PPCAC_8466 [Pristionchus entomophagus]